MTKSESGFVAALPMYDWPETRAETDAEWARLRDAFRRAGIDAPEKIVRRNADLPSAPGGIRDDAGKIIAPDPATLPPDQLDFHALWLHPALLFAQTCWGPMELGLARQVQLVGQPSYDAFEGGRGALYSSALVMRKRNAPPSHLNTPPSGLPAISLSRGEIGGVGEDANPPALAIGKAGEGEVISPLEREMAGRPERGVQAPLDGAPLLPLELIRGRRFAYNSLDSMSGIIALTRDLEAVGENLDIFSKRVESGGHRASIVAVAKGRADVAAIDCRSWAMARRFEPAAREVAVVGWTARRKGLPFITARTTPAKTVAALREVMATFT